MEKHLNKFRFVNVLAIVLAFSLLYLGFVLFTEVNTTRSAITAKASSDVAQQAITVTKENLALYLESQQIVDDLPSNAVLLLKFYNFNTGERQWEDYYKITKSKVEKVTGEVADIEIKADVVIIIHSKYISELGKGFCSTIKQAKANGDFGADILLNTAQFLWKFKSMMKYKSCLGY